MVPEAFRHELRVGAVEAAIWILVTLLSAQNRSVVGGFAEHVDVALEDRDVVGETGVDSVHSSRVLADY